MQGEIFPNRDDSGIIPFKLTEKYANEFAFYLEADHSFSDNFTLNALGLERQQTTTR